VLCRSTYSWSRAAPEAAVKYMLLIYFDDIWNGLTLAERQEVYRGSPRS
jgi:hypothetical protein